MSSHVGFVGVPLAACSRCFHGVRRLQQTSSSFSSFLQYPRFASFQRNQADSRFSPEQSNERSLGRTRVLKALVIEVGSSDELEKVFEHAADSLVVIDYSTSWCGPCKVIAPKFEEMSDEYKDVVFVKVMGDKNQEAEDLMKREGIRSVPAFHFWKAKKRVFEVTGAKEKAIEDGIRSHR